MNSILVDDDDDDDVEKVSWSGEPIGSKIKLTPITSSSFHRIPLTLVFTLDFCLLLNVRYLLVCQWDGLQYPHRWRAELSKNQHGPLVTQTRLCILLKFFVQRWVSDHMLHFLCVCVCLNALYFFYPIYHFFNSVSFSSAKSKPSFSECKFKHTSIIKTEYCNIEVLRTACWGPFLLFSFWHVC